MTAVKPIRFYQSAKPEEDDTLKVEPEDLQEDRAVVLKRVINRKYANRVLPKVGLCISVYNIRKASEGMILHQDGCFYHKAIFQMIVYRPLIEEVIEAKVLSCSEQGLRLYTKFFDDIRVPAEGMDRHACYDPTKALWFWNPDFELTSDDVAQTEGMDFTEQRNYIKKKLLETPEDDRYIINLGELVRVRVEEEYFHDTGPTRPPKAPPIPGLSATTEEAETLPPYRIKAKMNEEGLGVLGWWRNAAEAPADD